MSKISKRGLNFAFSFAFSLHPYPYKTHVSQKAVFLLNLIVNQNDNEIFWNLMRIKWHFDGKLPRVLLNFDNYVNFDSHISDLHYKVICRLELGIEKKSGNLRTGITGFWVRVVNFRVEVEKGKGHLKRSNLYEHNHYCICF